MKALVLFLAEGVVLITLGTTLGCQRPSDSASYRGDRDAARRAEVSEPSVTVTGGRLRGNRVGNVSVYKGIPYAEPPTSDRRWQPPVPKAPWTGIREAAQYPAPCPQMALRKSPTDAPSFIGSEDCLYLNVWAPALTSPTERLPVMVFIHGGGSDIGSTTDAWGEPEPFLIYDSNDLARDGRVVVVTIQYRLGMLGFLALPELRREQDTGTTGNYGNLDKILALEWIKANAEAFGGDASRITIFGESAGAVSVCALLASPLAAGLFSGAIAQSAGCKTRGLASAMTDGLRFSRRVGCGKRNPAKAVECLRSLPSETLVRDQPAFAKDLFESTYAPTIDDHFLTGAPLKIIQAGKHNRVPVLLGSNSQEEKFFFLPIGLSGVDVLARLGTRIGVEAYEKLLSYYPESQHGGSKEEAAIAAVSDIAITCPMQDEALRLAQSSNEPVYAYYYTHEISGTAKLSASVTVRASVSTTVTIEGPLGQFRRQIAFTKNVSGTGTLSLSKPIQEIAPMHAFELPFVFQHWDQWAKSLNAVADAVLGKHLAALQDQAQNQANARMQQAVPGAVQAGINKAVAKFRRDHPLLGGILRISNTPVRVGNVTATVNNPDINLRFTGGEKEVQRAFLRYWTNFAHSRNPANDWNRKLANKAPAWPALASSTLSYLELNRTQKILPDFKREACAFINEAFH